MFPFRVNEPNPVEQSLVKVVQEAESRRLARWSIATEAYYGRIPNTLLVKPGKPNDNVKVNYARLFVDKGAAFLFGKEVNFEIDEDKTTPEEEWLARCWRRNRKMGLLNNLGVNGGIYGHPFVRILKPKVQGEPPRLVALDPMTVNVEYADDDIDDVISYTISFPTVDQNTGKGKTKRFRIVQEAESLWTTIEEEIIPGERVWTEINRDPWPYPFPPIVHCQNLSAPNEFWGVADLEPDVIDLLQAMNFTLSNVRKIIRYHGHPQTWGRGFQAKDLKRETDEVLIFQNPEAVLSNLEMVGDLGNSMSFYKELKQALHATARMPEVALGSMEGVGALSGVALKIVYQPLLDKTETKRRTYGEMLERLNGILLVMGDYRTEIEDGLVKTVWPEMLPRDEMVDRQAAAQDRELGIASIETVSGKLGYDYKMEQERIKREKAEGIGVPPAPPVAPAPPKQDAPTQPPEQPAAAQATQDMVVST